MSGTYVAAFEGQGGEITSLGIPLIVNKLRAIGVTAEAYAYNAVNDTRTLQHIVSQLRSHAKIGLLGYSLGCTTATWLQTIYKCDLLLCIAESSWGDNHPVNHKNTMRSVLWYGGDWLSNAGLRDGFDVKHPVGGPFFVPVLGHLAMDLDPNVVAQVVSEVQRLDRS
jgi:hypothetical protein